MKEQLIAVAIVVAAIFSIVIYLGMREDKAEQRGIDKQVAVDIAKANQELATRRARDAEFDKMDARAFCISAGLEWVFSDDKSFCR